MQATRTCRDTPGPCPWRRGDAAETTGAGAASTRALSGNELQPAVTGATAVVNNRSCFIENPLNEETFKGRKIKARA
jgi:hypothetical protein